MITRTLFICSLLVFFILLFFHFVTTPDTTRVGRSSVPVNDTESAAAQAGKPAGSKTATARRLDPSIYSKPRPKRRFRDLPAMNIPSGFFMVAVPVMLLLFIYIVGLMLNDISREEQAAVEKIFGKLND